MLEAAHGGTLFLDEIGDLPPSAQARLAQYLDEGTFRRLGSSDAHRVDVRIVAATHRDLRQLTKSGQFREDLFARLNSVSLRVPPLRERGDDVVAIAQTTLERLAGKFNKRGLVLSAAAMDAMRRYRWPGNVRELENALERAVILCRSTTIGADMLPIHADTSHTAQADAQRESSSSLEGYFLRFVLDNEDRLTEDRAGEGAGDQPQEPLGTPPATQHPPAADPHARALDANLRLTVAGRHKGGAGRHKGGPYAVWYRRIRPRRWKVGAPDYTIAAPSRRQPCPC